MSSTPYQVVLMKIRHIYRWDDPVETGVYLGSYLFFWAIGHLAGAAVSLKNHVMGSGSLMLMVIPPGSWHYVARAYATPVPSNG